MNSAEAVNYRGLWSAVILQAFVDLRPRAFKTPKPVIVPTGDRHEDRIRYLRALGTRKLTIREWENTRSSARRWIFSKDTHPCSFLWICDCLDFDPQWLRQMASSRDGIERVLTGKVV